jgi:hypothetical protein
MTPAIYHKGVAIGASPRFHDYRAQSGLGEEGLFLVKSPLRVVFIGGSYREAAGNTGCRKIERPTGTLFGRNTQS